MVDSLHDCDRAAIRTGRITLTFGKNMEPISKVSPYDRTSYLIARAPQVDSRHWNRPFITYSPPTGSDPSPWIGLFTGVTGHDPGGECSPQNVLERGGLLEIVDECEASWFLPIIQRLAVGEPVSLDEIESEYTRRHGTALESKEWGRGWFPSVQAAYDEAHANG